MPARVRFPRLRRQRDASLTFSNRVGSCLRLLLLLITTAVSLRSFQAPLALAASSAQSASVTMEVEAGFGGYFKGDDWLPVFVTVTNSGDSFNGTIQLEFPEQRTTDVRFSRSVDLPRGSKKRVTIYGQSNSFPTRVNVRLLNGDAVAAEFAAPLKPLADPDGLALLVASDATVFADLNGLALGENGHIFAATARLDLIPSDPQSLRSVAYLLFNDVATGDLNADQRKSIGSWVSAGGHLIVFGGPNYAKTADALVDLLPMTPTGTRSLDTLASLQLIHRGRLSGTPPYVVATGTIKAGADVLLLEEGAPLIVQRAQGLGKVTYITLDNGLAPLKGWTGQEALWSVLLPRDPSAPPLERNIGLLSQTSMQRALQQIPTLDNPNLTGLALYLAIFVIVIGPLNYLILRVLRRRELAWLTIPLLAALFAAGLYGFGISARQNDVIVKVISVVRGTADSDQANVDSYLGVFSPARRSYTLQLTDGALPSPFVGGPPSVGGSAVGVSPTTKLEPTWIRQGAGVRYDSLSVDAWQMQPLAAELSTPNAGPIRVEAHIEAGQLVGRVANESDFSLQSAVLFLGLNAQRLGDIPAHGAANLSLALAPGPDRSFNGIAELLLGPEDTSASENDRFLRDERSAVLSSVFAESRPTSPSWWNATPYVIGWQSSSPLQVSVPNHNPTLQASSLRIIAIRVNFGDKDLVVPPGLFGKELFDREARYFSKGPGGFTLADGGVIVRYYAPVGARGLETQRLNLRLEAVRRQPGSNPRPFVPEISLFNFSRGVWVDLDSVSLGDNPINDPQQFVSPAGILQLWVAAPNDNGPDPTTAAVQINQLDFELAGKRALP